MPASVGLTSPMDERTIWAWTENAMPLLYVESGAVAVLTLSRPQACNAGGEDYNGALWECCRGWRMTPTSALSS